LGKTRGNGDGGFDQVAALLKNVKERIPRKLPDLFMGLVLNVGRFGKNHFGKLPKTVSANCRKPFRQSCRIVTYEITDSAKVDSATVQM
jgi:hypothetical protein